MWPNIASVIKKECKDIFRDPKTVVVLIGVPIIFTLLFGFLYEEKVVLNISTVIWDMDNTSLSRNLVSSFNDSDKFSIGGYVDSEAELQSKINNGEANVAIVIPEDFASDVKTHKTPKVLVIVNGTNMLISNSVLTSANEIIQTISAGIGIKILEGKGFLPEQALDSVAPVRFSPRIWYNPTFNYTNFLLPGLVAAAVQQVTMLYTAISIVKEKSKLPRFLENWQGTVQYFLGKLMPYWLINLVNMHIVIFICAFIFGIPFRGSYFVFLIMSAIFILSITCFGIFASILARNELEATQLSMLIAVPSFLLSGYTWPTFAMPAPLQALAKLLPLTYYVVPLRKIMLMGAGFEALLSELTSLVLFLAVLMPLSFVLIRQQYRKRCYAQEISETSSVTSDI